MTIVWEPEARREAAKIRAWIRRENPSAARRWGEQLAARVAALGAFPGLGRVVPEYDDADLRELILDSYRVWYRLREDRVRVVHVWDSRRGTLPDRTRESPVAYQADGT